MIAVAATLGCVGGSVFAMSSTENVSPGCRVVNGDKLPAESGGADALCRAIAEAAAATAPGVDYSITINVLPRSRLSATVTLDDGRRLPEFGMASMDKPLTAGSFRRFAASIAEELVRLGTTKS